jgi:hypothetical protein
MSVRIILSLAFLGLVTSGSWAASVGRGRVAIQRDATFEENLRWEASEDQAITPARVIRYMMGMRGSKIFTSDASAEFIPIVNVYDSRYRIVAAIAFKFN